MRQKLTEIQRGTDESTVIVGDSTPLYQKWTEPAGRKLVRPSLNSVNTINQLDIKNIYSLLHLTTMGYIFFSGPHGTFIQRDHVLGHKTYLNKFFKIKIIQCLFSGHNGIKLEFNNR